MYLLWIVGLVRVEFKGKAVEGNGGRPRFILNPNYGLPRIFRKHIFQCTKLACDLKGLRGGEYVSQRFEG